MNTIFKISVSHALPSKGNQGRGGYFKKFPLLSILAYLVLACSATIAEPQQPPPSGTLTLTIENEINPTSAVSFSVNEGALLSFTVTVTDTDTSKNLQIQPGNFPTGASLINCAQQPRSGTRSCKFTWTPSYSQAGSYTGLFIIGQEAGQGASTSAKMNITVGDVNHAPILNSISNWSIPEGNLLSFSVSGSDQDLGTVLTYSTSTLPAGATFDPSNGIFSWTPNYGEAGNYSVTFTVTDNGTPNSGADSAATAKLTASQAVIITVGDVNHPPTLTPLGSQTVDAGKLLSFTVSGSDLDPGTVLSYSASPLPAGATFDPSTGIFSWTPDYTQAGNYLVTFTVTDNGTPNTNSTDPDPSATAPLSASENVAITVGNVNRPPTIADPRPQPLEEGMPFSLVISGEDPDGAETITYSASGLPAGATFNANSHTFEWTPASVGNYTVVFTVTDNGGLTASVSVLMTVQDTTPPKVTAPADVIQEATGPQTSVDIGQATATDLVDGQITPTSNAPDTYPVGTTVVTWTAKDKAGNEGTAIQLVTVKDTKPPALTLPSLITAEATGPNGAAVSYTATASDLVDGSIIPSCTPASGSTFPLVTTIVSCSATDAHGNTALGSFTITVQDTTPPQIALVNVLPAANSNGWNKSAVTVTWSCSDSGSGPVAPSVSQTVSTEGTNQSVTGTCQDKAGNVASNTVGNISIDTTEPTLNPSVSPNPVLLNGTATASANASDSLSGVASQSCASVDTSSVGSKSVNCTAVDKAGNSASANASYSVQYATAGLCLGSPGHAILQPINADGTSVFKQGSTVPTKFRVCDANGNSIGTAGVVSSFKLIRTSAGSSALDEAIDSTTPDAAFRWSATDQQWIFNMSTKSLNTACTYSYQITLNDGSTIDFRFGLR